MSEDVECTEYTVLRELIDLYRNQPCLWDTKSPNYKCTNQKILAWAVLLSKYKEIDPDANLTAVKRKIDSMKAGYQRELRKVNRSILESTGGGNDIHIPSLWYFNLLSFLNKNDLSVDHLNKTKESEDNLDEQPNDGVYMLIVNENNDPPRKVKRISKLKSRQKPKLESPSESSHYQVKQYDDDDGKQMYHYTQELEKSIRNTPKGDEESARILNISPFAVYVGKQLEDMLPCQRNYAEKIISEVIFLGKTDNLSVHSRIETPIIERPKATKPTKRGRKRVKERSPDFATKSCKITSSDTPPKRPRRKATIKDHSSDEEEDIPTLFLSRSDDDHLSNTSMGVSLCSEPNRLPGEASDDNMSVLDENSNSSIDRHANSDVISANEENSASDNDDNARSRETSLNDEDSVLRTLLLT